MKLIVFNDTNISKVYDNVTDLNYDRNKLSFNSNMQQIIFNGFKANYITVDDTSNIQEGDSVSSDSLLEFAKDKKQNELVNGYKNDLVQNVTTSLVWTDGLNVVFGYSTTDQLNYSKRANTLSLDTTITSFEIGTKSHSAITLTREQFIQIMNDFDNHEMTLYKKLDNLRTQVDNAISVNDINLIVWS